MLFVSECVPVYLSAADSDVLNDWITRAVPNAGIVTYEQIRPDDRFGQVMVINLCARAGSSCTARTRTQHSMLPHGASSSAAGMPPAPSTLPHTTTCCAPRSACLAQIEFLDEWEEFILLA
ncbi:carboxy methyl transferase for protein phosphatase 2A [Coemansia spiralis]|nr:carboxy methyl transferase for protein phosphatase 2A [Coemansia spiralis]